MSRVFISYRRDDAAGYAGRLEERLERELGKQNIFRDVLDIAPGADFVAAIRERLAHADTVLVLIGPRWAGEGAPGERRIDRTDDFVRLEVALALKSDTVRVIPVLLPGAQMPAENMLPQDLQPLARRNAIMLTDNNWDVDVSRLVVTIGRPHPWKLWLAVGGVLLLAALLLMQTLAPMIRQSPPAPQNDRSGAELLIGTWQGKVRYGWGDQYEERFEFKQHAGELTGTASFLTAPRPIENLRVEGRNVHFDIRSMEHMGDSTREVTRSYAAELRGEPPDTVLAVRMITTGSHGSHAPLEFEARRGGIVPASASSPAR